MVGTGQPDDDSSDEPSGETVAALRSAAESGVRLDGLEASREPSGYRLVVDGDGHTGLSAETFASTVVQYPDHVSEWDFWRRRAPQAEDRWAFCRWLEDADDVAPTERESHLARGRVVTWGQLAIEVRRLVDGDRRYDLTHVDDTERPHEELEEHTDPRALREIRRTDDRGRYRPLSTAPTLSTGWAVLDLDASAVVDAVEACYPATVPNWHREREGELDVSHWRESAARQTGIYDLVDELEGEAVDALARACCVDSECLKRREWDEDDGPVGDLDADRGSGEFPCREPCSLVIAAAREFVKTEREEPETYELRLRPREKAHLERLLDAVADGEAADVDPGRVTDPANRLRTRYLRERLFEDGELPAIDGEHDGDASD